MTRPVARRLWLLPFLASCASLPGQATTRVGERRIDLAVAGQGGPVVVFESGLGAELTTWDRVFPTVAGFTTAFAYSRPGLGHSDPSPGLRLGSVVVEDLRATLRSKGLAPPYVLVGHSLGGLYMQLFARRYPDEVAALLLVDSSHPSQMAGARGRQVITWWTTAVRLWMYRTRGREFRGLDETGREVLRAPPFVGHPVTVLNAGTDPTASGRELSEREALRVDLFRLNAGCKRQWVDSGHSIQRERPEVVIEAIRELVDAVRRPSNARERP
jgi:pimeloyl-ACP methyl ester carboxylesterase